MIAGELLGLRASVQTYSPLFYVHWDMAAAAAATLPVTYSKRAQYVATGSIEIGGQASPAEQMTILKAGQAACFTATQPAIALGVGGEPIGECFRFWNFVSSSHERLEQAKQDWQRQRMKLPDVDHDEFIPLPP